MAAAFAMALTAIGLFGWGGYLAAVSTGDGDTPPLPACS
jgi:hypothetical protein